MNKILKSLLVATSVMLMSGSAIHAQEETEPVVPDEQVSPRSTPLPVVMPCVPDVTEMFENLQKKYNEQPIALGAGTVFIPGNRTANGQLTLWYNSDGEKTFTIVFIIEGTSIGCMLASGKNMDLLQVMFGTPI